MPCKRWGGPATELSMPTKVQFPQLEALTAGLSAVLGSNGSGGTRVNIIDRSPSVFASTYPSEIVTCRVGDRAEIKVYCKYMTGLGSSSYGHRGGLPYETQVYLRVLQASPLSLPKFYGPYQSPPTSPTRLLLY